MNKSKHIFILTCFFAISATYADTDCVPRPATPKKNAAEIVRDVITYANPAIWVGAAIVMAASPFITKPKYCEEQEVQDEKEAVEPDPAQATDPISSTEKKIIRLATFVANSQQK